MPVRRADDRLAPRGPQPLAGAPGPGDLGVWTGLDGTGRGRAQPWKKCRAPVRYMVIPAASAAAITSSS
ncbi:MAG TPA: hypothetical protein VIG75_04445, partial [Citricoccus sp.]